MAIHYRHVTSLDQKRNLLKAIIEAETEVRALREKKRLEKYSQTRTFGTIFEPITATMKQLKEVTDKRGPFVPEQDLLGAIDKVEDDTPPMVPNANLIPAANPPSPNKKGKTEDGLLNTVNTVNTVFFLQ